MTREEAIKIIGEAEFLTHRDADYAIDIYDAINKAIDELEKADKYRWHDLRENPNDVPINRYGYPTGYMVKEDTVEQPYSAYWDGNFWEEADGTELDGIIAWKEIEPFEV